MSKELKALEKIDHTVCMAFNENNNAVFNKDQFDHADCKDIEEFMKCYSIVEKALKNYEELKNKPIMLYGRTHGQTQELIDIICKNHKEVKITNLEDEEKLKALEILKNRFDFKVCDDGKNYFLEIGYFWGKKWAFVARRIPNRKELAICKKALGIKKSHKKKFSKGRGSYYECSPIYEENLKLKKVVEIIKNKRVNVAYLIWCIETFDYKEGLALEQYNLSCAKDEWTITQEEYDLLKEVMKDD